ncbi:hypothetical protein HanIR_Chr13g0642001 [Helianthus annuus]|nr:hypothetical protein HanIR_Chr13g0642001 [Helianthus annuus]
MFLIRSFSIFNLCGIWIYNLLINKLKEKVSRIINWNLLLEFRYPIIHLLMFDMFAR